MSKGRVIELRGFKSVNSGYEQAAIFLYGSHDLILGQHHETGLMQVTQGELYWAGNLDVVFYDATTQEQQNETNYIGYVIASNPPSGETLITLSFVESDLSEIHLFALGDNPLFTDDFTQESAMNSIVYSLSFTTIPFDTIAPAGRDPAQAYQAIVHDFSGTPDALLMAIETDTLSNPVILIDEKNVYGTTNGENILGGDEADILWGFGGNDHLVTSGNNDTVFGGEGNDVIQGQNQNDILHGDEGNDLIWAADGDDILHGGLGDDTLTGGHGNDEINGNDGNDLIVKFSGNGLIYAGEGNDQIYGGFQSDHLYGDLGDDLLIGDKTKYIGAADTIDGGSGNDTLCGGIGADTFIFRPNDDSDIIANFNTETQEFARDLEWHDIIKFEGFDFVNAAELMGHFSDSDNGAVFHIQGSEILFWGVTSNEVLQNVTFEFV